MMDSSCAGCFCDLSFGLLKNECSAKHGALYFRPDLLMGMDETFLKLF